MKIKLLVIIGITISQISWAGSPLGLGQSPESSVIMPKTSSTEGEIISPLGNEKEGIITVELNVKDIMHGNLPEEATGVRVFYEKKNKVGGVTVVEMKYNDGTTKLYINTEGIAPDGTGNFEVQDITGYENEK